MTFGDLFREVARRTGAPPAGELTPAQRLAAVSVAIAARRDALGPLRRSAARPGFAIPFERLLDELQSAGLEPDSLGSSAQTLEGSAYLGDLTALFAAYAEVRDRLGLLDAARRRAGRDRVAARGAGGLGRAAGLPLRAGRPDAEPAPADRGAERGGRGHRRSPLRGGQRRARRPGDRCFEGLREIAADTELLSGPAELEPFGIDPLLVHLERELRRQPSRRGAPPARRWCCCAPPASAARRRRSPPRWRS